MKVPTQPPQEGLGKAGQDLKFQGYVGRHTKVNGIISEKIILKDKAARVETLSRAEGQQNYLGNRPFVRNKQNTKGPTGGRGGKIPRVKELIVNQNGNRKREKKDRKKEPTDDSRDGANSRRQF